MPISTTGEKPLIYMEKLSELGVSMPEVVRVLTVGDSRFGALLATRDMLLDPDLEWLFQDEPLVVGEVMKFAGKYKCREGHIDITARFIKAYRPFFEKKKHERIKRLCDLASCVGRKRLAREAEAVIGNVRGEEDPIMALASALELEEKRKQSKAKRRGKSKAGSVAAINRGGPDDASAQEQGAQSSDSSATHASHTGKKRDTPMTSSGEGGDRSRRRVESRGGEHANGSSAEQAAATAAAIADAAANISAIDEALDRDIRELVECAMNNDDGGLVDSSSSDQTASAIASAASSRVVTPRDSGMVGLGKSLSGAGMFSPRSASSLLLMEGFDSDDEASQVDRAEFQEPDSPRVYFNGSPVTVGSDDAFMDEDSDDSFSLGSGPPSWP